MSAKITRRTVAITLGVIIGVSGELLAFYSMVRIAGPASSPGGRLGFPDGATWAEGGAPDLRWTLFAVVSVAAWLGAVLWTSPRRADRRAGAPINVIASSVAGICVGLDHSGHGAPDLPELPGVDWRLTGFLIGLAIPLFSSVVVHVIARMTVDGVATAPEHEGPGWLARLRERIAAATEQPTEQPTEQRTVGEAVTELADPDPAPEPEPITEPITEPVEIDAAPIPEPAPEPAPTPRHRRRERRRDTGPERTDSGRWPSVAAAAREWLTANWRPGMEPVALTDGLADPKWLGYRIPKQAASTHVKWAETNLTLAGQHGRARDDESADRELAEVSA